jgi:acetylornithine/N-succinyldiaminopimelate aminotransferase
MSDSALFSTYARYPITLVKGKGSRLWDDQGKEYVDFMSGLAVTNLGHVPDAVKAALVSQLDELWHVSNLFSIPNQEKAARLLVDNSCADAVFFCNSGAEANEAAIKLARRYHQKVKGNNRYEIITFNQSFHGRTLATLTATGQDKVKEGFLPLPEGFRHVPLHDIAALEAAVNENTAAIMLELVQAEGGVINVDADFLRGVRALCDRHGILLILDEVQTGMGRTGKMFAYEHYDVEPDVFTLAKGIGSGFPVGAMLAKEHVKSAFTPGAHATTFGGTPIAMAVVAATIETMLSENAVGRAAEAGDYLIAQLQNSLNSLPNVIEIRGRGLLVGILCTGPVAEQIAELHQRGLLVVPAGPNVIRLLPNLLVTHEDIDTAVGLIAAVLTEQAAVNSVSS